METTIITKHCNRCDTDKPETAFAIARSSRDGRFHFCRECQKDYYRANRERIMSWQQAHPERRKVYNKRYYDSELGHMFHNQGVERHHKIHPERVAARMQAFRYRKKLMKDACEVCGSKEDLQRHHPDYSQPLVIKTLCHKCHLAEHGKRKIDTLLISPSLNTL